MQNCTPFNFLLAVLYDIAMFVCYYSRCCPSLEISLNMADEA